VLYIALKGPAEMPVPLFFESGEGGSARVLTLAGLSQPAVQLLNFRASEVRGAASLKRGFNSF